jgi:hypothetical protein
VEVVERAEISGKIEETIHVELVDGSSVVKELEKLNLLRTQIDDGIFDFRFILDAEEFDAVKVDLREIAIFEPGSADVNDLVVVVQICTSQLQHGLGLEGLNKGGAETEDHVAFEIFMLGDTDLRALFGTLEAEFALVLALVEIAEVGLDLCARGWTPVAFVRGDLRSICGERELWIRSEISGNLLRLKLVDVALVRL